MVQPNFANRTLFHGDNLGFLRKINSGTIHLIATDPPFNKGRDFHATPDSLASGAQFEDRWNWIDDVHDDWLDTLQDGEHQEVWQAIMAAKNIHSDGMGAFLCWLSVRLLEMHRILRDDGSLYIQCDDAAGHYIKLLLDGIFGRRNFRNDVVWKRTAGRSDGNRFGRVHDYLLFYVKDEEDYTWNRPYLPHDPEYVKRTYRNQDPLGHWQSSDLTASGPRSGESGEPWRGVDPKERGRHWATPVEGGMNDFIIERGLIPGWPDTYPGVHERLDALDAADLVHWPDKEDGMPRTETVPGIDSR